MLQSLSFILYSISALLWSISFVPQLFNNIKIKYNTTVLNFYFVSSFLFANIVNCYIYYNTSFLYILAFGIIVNSIVLLQCFIIDFISFIKINSQLQFLDQLSGYYNIRMKSFSERTITLYNTDSCCFFLFLKMEMGKVIFTVILFLLSVNIFLYNNYFDVLLKYIVAFFNIIGMLVQIIVVHTNRTVKGLSLYTFLIAGTAVIIDFIVIVFNIENQHDTYQYFIGNVPNLVNDILLIILSCIIFVQFDKYNLKNQFDDELRRLINTNYNCDEICITNVQTDLNLNSECETKTESEMSFYSAWD